MDKKLEQKYVNVRKTIINTAFSNLNDMQRKAVMATEGPLLILAGAGSGKTTVLINRIENLIRFGCASDTSEIPYDAREEDIRIMEAGGEQAYALASFQRVEPWQILAITFTNKAADELKHRLLSKLGDTALNIWALTFHSCCVRILRRNADRLGFPVNFSIYDTSDSISLIKHIIKDLDLDEKKGFAPKEVLSIISRAKDAQVDCNIFESQARSSHDIMQMNYASIYTEYMHRMFSAGAMDFDDLLSFTVKLLQENIDVLEYWQDKFKYVMVDEYQDTNNLQYKLTSLLAGGLGNICVVGDDDQSIYKFRGATIENILSFEVEYKNCRTIRLEQNYRSTSNILSAANAVICNNTERKGKRLWTNNECGDKVVIYSANNQDSEAQFVSGQILASYGRGRSWKDHAILYRMNAQSNTLERALKRNGIPYRIIGGTRFFDRAEIKDMLAYLCLISSPDDNLRLLRIINVPARGIGQKTIDAITRISNDTGNSIFGVLNYCERYPELGKSTTKLRLFTELINELRDFSKENSLDELFDELVEKTGYVKLLESKNTIEDTARAENIRELKSSIIDYMQNSSEKSLSGFLAEVALYTDLDNYDSDADCVILMTMHAAKGLEFPVVFITGAEEGIFPGMKSIGDTQEMEEERRLCYVAITRAKSLLYITCARQRMLFGHTTCNKRSRFIDEIPTETIDERCDYNLRNSNLDHSNVDYRSRSFIGYKHIASNYDGIYKQSVKNKSNIVPMKDINSNCLPDFKVGDTVCHNAFGRGVIASMRPMGNDSLIEIEFERGNKKKLMLRAAAQYMEKC